MLTADDKYFCHNSKNLQLPNQAQLSKNLKTFCCLFIAFSESTLIFEKNKELHTYCARLKINSQVL